MSLRIVIIGANAAGAKAACKAKRFNPEAEVTLIDRRTIMSFSACGIPYYVSDTVAALKELASTTDGVVRDPTYFGKVKGVKALTGVEAIGINRAEHTVSLFDRNGAGPYTIPYDRLILATGSFSDIAALSSMGCPNILTVKTVEDAVSLKDKAIRGRAACVVGGGLGGLEIAEALHLKGMQVTILEQHDHLLYDVLDHDLALLLQKHLEEQGIKVLVNCRVAAFDGTTRLEKAVTNLGEVPAHLIVLAPGVVPNVTLAEAAGLILGPTGAIAVNERMETSDPDIFACGDCTEATHLVTGRKVYIPRGSTANKQGHVAGINAAGGSETFSGILGTTIIKVLDFNAGKTGISERAAREQGLTVEHVLVPADDRAHFFPAAKPITLKMVAEKETGRILGIQAIGEGAVDKRIDATAVAITLGANLEQLSRMDLAYAAPFAAATDILIVAAHLLKAKLAGKARGISPAVVEKMLEEGETPILLDVRSPEEQREGVIRGSILLPLGMLRESLATLPADKEIVVICKSGHRAYEAQQILKAAGFADAGFMEGGIMAWPGELKRPVGG